jgi:hypothetical protein
MYGVCSEDVETNDIRVRTGLARWEYYKEHQKTLLIDFPGLHLMQHV